MALINDLKIDALFKAFVGKARTSTNKQFFEETIPTAYDVHAKDVYLEDIPSIPPADTAGVVKKYTKLVLTKDISVANNLAWVALPSHQTNWSSGSATNIDQILKNFISPKYGAGYVVKVFKGDGTRIPELDATDWLFDYKSGVLTFSNNPGNDGSTVEKSIYIEVYQYVGKTASDGISHAGNAEIENVFKKILINKDNTTLVTLEDEYVNDGKSLMVFLNGLLVFPGLDYEETSTTSITFNYDLMNEDIVAVRSQKLIYK